MLLTKDGITIDVLSLTAIARYKKIGFVEVEQEKPAGKKAGKAPDKPDEKAVKDGS
jgi:hypothetical protein